MQTVARQNTITQLSVYSIADSQSLVANNKQHGITGVSSITPTQCRRLFSPDSHNGKCRCMIYDIYSLQLGFHPVAMVGKIVQKQERDKLYTEGQTIKKHGMHKIENKHSKQGNKHAKNIKKHYFTTGYCRKDKRGDRSDRKTRKKT